MTEKQEKRKKKRRKGTKSKWIDGEISKRKIKKSLKTYFESLVLIKRMT